MEVIFKYKLQTTDEQEIEMPLGADVLTVQVLNDEPYVYAKVNTNYTSIKYRFRIFGTGHQIEDEFSGKYIGTYQIFNGSGVFHLFLI